MSENSRNRSSGFQSASFFATKNNSAAGCASIISSIATSSANQTRRVRTWNCSRCASTFCAAFGLTEKDLVVRVSDRGVLDRFFAREKCSRRSAGRKYLQVDRQIRARTARQNRGQTRQACGFGVRNFQERREKRKAGSSLVEGLRARGLAQFVDVDVRIVRGLAYYTGIGV